MGERHTHPISILGNMSRLVVLLLFPVVRGFWTALSGGGLTAWAAGAWFDILVVMLILFFAIARWYSVQYAMDRRALVLTQGVLFRKRRVIPLRQATTLSTERLWWLRPFGAVKFRVDTMAGGTREADVVLILTPKEAQRLMSYHRAKDQAPGYLSMRYKPRAVSIAALSALTSNSFAGILLTAAFISSLGDIVGEEFGEQVYATLGRVAEIIAAWLPPVTGGIALVLLGGYMVAFCANCLKHIRFSVLRRHNHLYVHSGFFTKLSYILDVRSIGYLDLRQGILTKLLGMYAAYVYCPGFGKRKEDVAAIVPVSFQREMGFTLKNLLRDYPFVPLSQHPNRGAIGKFIIDPFWPCTLIPVVTFTLRYYFPSWSSVIVPVGLMAAVPAYWFLIVRLIDYMTTGLGYDGHTLTLRYSKGYTLHTVSIPRDRVAHIHLRQSPIQRLDGSCDVLIFTKGERAAKHHIKNLKQKQVAKLFDVPEISQ